MHNNAFTQDLANKKQKDHKEQKFFCGFILFLFRTHYICINLNVHAQMHH